MALSEKLAKLDEAKRTELMLKIKDTVTIEEAVKVLEDAGIEATKEELQEAIKNAEDVKSNNAKANIEVLDEKDLENVNGGGFWSEFYENETHGNVNDVNFVVHVGDFCEVSLLGTRFTCRCQVVNCAYVKDYYMNNQYYYFDMYDVKPVEDHWYWSKDTVKRIQRDEIEKP